MRKLYYASLCCAALSANAQWVEVACPVNANLWKMGWATEDVGYMNTNSALLKTVDGGETWTTTSYTGNVDGDFSFPTSSVGYMAGFYDIIKKTTDGGNTWTSVTVNNQALPVRSVSFVDANTGWVVGINGFIRKTTNGGASWTVQTASGTAQFRRVHLVNANVGTAIGDNGAIRRTTNGGSSWTTIFGAPNTYLNDIFFLDENIGFIVGGQGTILTTSNGGVNWTTMNSGTTQWLETVCFRNPLEGYVGGTSGFMMKTTNGGLTWVVENNPFFLSTQSINDIVWKTDHYLAIGSAGNITRTGTVGIRTIGTDGIVMELGPNPATTSVTIRVPELADRARTVRVFDTGGSLLHTTTLAGDRDQLDVTGLSDGLYVLEVSVGASLARMKLVVQR
ncbi:MAG: T9SS type A sorting domain-containing protein [Flavobacteriales bacterium]|nr:T9SS type A sorting domain-containing protein [Flavobacteriales bacterium]